MQQKTGSSRRRGHASSDEIRRIPVNSPERGDRRHQAQRDRHHVGDHPEARRSSLGIPPLRRRSRCKAQTGQHLQSQPPVPDQSHRATARSARTNRAATPSPRTVTSLWTRIGDRPPVRSDARLRNKVEDGELSRLLGYPGHEIRVVAGRRCRSAERKWRVTQALCWTRWGGRLPARGQGLVIPVHPPIADTRHKRRCIASKRARTPATDLAKAGGIGVGSASGSWSRSARNAARRIRTCNQGIRGIPPFPTEARTISPSPIPCKTRRRRGGRALVGGGYCWDSPR